MTGVNSGNDIIHKEVLEQKTHRVKKTMSDPLRSTLSFHACVEI